MIIKKLFHQAIIVLFVLLILLTVMGCAEDTKDRDYGVFLSVTDDLDSLAEYKTVVIDAQYFSKEDIDGFFVDNCDLYYFYPSEEIMNALTNIMQAMINTGKEVIINGGDSYLDAYCNSGGHWDDVITGINQESVFSKILWDEDKFGTAEAKDKEYFQDYIERYAAKGADIYLLEYTTDKNLIKEIKEYCEEKAFNYYISDSLELD